MEPDVQAVEQFELPCVIIAPVANRATNLRPVFLFDIGVVVSSSGAATGESDLLFVSQRMPCGNILRGCISVFWIT
jgi:hypothetical protein